MRWKPWTPCTTPPPHQFQKKKKGNKEYILITSCVNKQSVWSWRYRAEQNRHGSILMDLQSSRKENQQLILNNNISLKYTKGTKQ